jgi:hypothetical protein
MSFISDEAATDALNWLLTNAKALGEAKRNAVLTESMTKRVRAIETAKSEKKTVSERENDALASFAYLKAIEDEAVAAGEYQRLLALRDAATARIEMWRSLSATQRALRAA